MSLHNRLSTLLLALLAVALVVPAARPARAQQTDLILATATIGGTYYPVGVAIATLTSIKLAATDQLTMTAITSAGSAENVQLLKQGNADLAILQGLFGAMAWQGKGVYAGKPQRDMRSVTMLWENVEHMLLLRRYVTSGTMSDMENIRGMRFAIGATGSGTEASGETILSGLGFPPEQSFDLQHMGYAPSASALKEGRIVGANLPGGPPVAAVKQAFAGLGADKVSLLSFTDAQLEQANREFPVWSRYVLAPHTYPGQEQPVQTIAQPNFLAVRPSVPDDVVYKLVKTIYANLDFLAHIHPATKAMSLDRAIRGLPVPLHPGAARFYREQGIRVPEHLLAD